MNRGYERKNILTEEQTTWRKTGSCVVRHLSSSWSVNEGVQRKQRRER